MWWRENFNDEDDDRVSEREHKLISTQATSVDFLLSNKFPRFVPFFHLSNNRLSYQKNEDSGLFEPQQDRRSPIVVFHISPVNWTLFLVEITNKSTSCALKPTWIVSSYKRLDSLEIAG